MTPTKLGRQNRRRDHQRAVKALQDNLERLVDRHTGVHVGLAGSNKGKERAYDDADQVNVPRAVAPNVINPGAIASSAASASAVEAAEAANSAAAATQRKGQLVSASAVDGKTISGVGATATSSSRSAVSTTSSSIRSSVSSTSVVSSTSSLPTATTTVSSSTSVSQIIESITSSSSSSSSSATLPVSASTAALVSAIASPTASSTRKSLVDNKGLLTVVIIASIIGAATVLFGLTWLCRRSSSAPTRRRRGRKGKFYTGNWSPGGESSEQFTPTEERGDLFEKDQQQRPLSSASGPNGYQGAAFNGSDNPQHSYNYGYNFSSDVVPAPHRLNSGPSVPVSPVAGQVAAQQQPLTGTGAARNSVGGGWTLYDQPLPRGSLDASQQQQQARATVPQSPVPAYQAPASPAMSLPRRPTFIERMLKEPTRMASADLPLRVYGNVAPAAPTGSEPMRQTTSGSGKLLNALKAGGATGSGGSGGAGKRDRYMSWAFGRKQSAGLADDSDFEGTIGAPDREVPRAKRVKNGQRFACDQTSASEAESSEDETPRGGPLVNQTNSNYAMGSLWLPEDGSSKVAREIVASPISESGPMLAFKLPNQPPPLAVMSASVPGRQLLATPATASPQSFADLQKRQVLIDQAIRQQVGPIPAEGNHPILTARIDKWWSASRDAEVPNSPARTFDSASLRSYAESIMMMASPGGGEGNNVLSSHSACRNLESLAASAGVSSSGLVQHSAVPSSSSAVTTLLSSVAPLDGHEAVVGGDSVSRSRVASPRHELLVEEEGESDAYQGSLRSPVVPLESSPEILNDVDLNEFPFSPADEQYGFSRKQSCVTMFSQPSAIESKEEQLQSQHYYELSRRPAHDSLPSYHSEAQDPDLAPYTEGRLSLSKPTYYKAPPTMTETKDVEQDGFQTRPLRLVAKPIAAKLVRTDSVCSETTTPSDYEEEMTREFKLDGSRRPSVVAANGIPYLQQGGDYRRRPSALFAKQQQHLLEEQRQQTSSRRLTSAPVAVTANSHVVAALKGVRNRVELRSISTGSRVVADEDEQQQIDNVKTRTPMLYSPGLATPTAANVLESLAFGPGNYDDDDEDDDDDDQVNEDAFRLQGLQARRARRPEMPCSPLSSSDSDISVRRWGGSSHNGSTSMAMYSSQSRSSYQRGGVRCVSDSRGLATDVAAKRVRGKAGVMPSLAMMSSTTNMAHPGSRRSRVVSKPLQLPLQQQRLHGGGLRVASMAY